MPINPESATLLMTMQSQHMHVSEKMVVMSHSDFSQSPFELGIGHPFLSRAKRTKIYNWMMDNNLPIHVLNRPWIQHHVPTLLSISGHVVKQCLMQSGSFTTSVVDAIMRLWTHLDDRMYNDFEGYYRERHKRWRHFLPATFALLLKKTTCIQM